MIQTIENNPAQESRRGSRARVHGRSPRASARGFLSVVVLGGWCACVTATAFAADAKADALREHGATVVLLAIDGTVAGPVTRFEAPGLDAFNFVLLKALGGGGMASMRIDPQGKAYGQRALEMMVPVPVGWALAA